MLSDYFGGFRTRPKEMMSMNRRRNKQRGRSIFGPRTANLGIWDGPLEAGGDVGGGDLGLGLPKVLHCSTRCRVRPRCSGP
jgi:hypothetical protein